MQTPSENTAQAALFLWAESLPYCTGCLYRPDMPKYTRKSKLLAASYIFTNSCENSKILSRLLSVLSLSRKFVHDRCCRPISAIILTASKLEAILDFWRGYRKTVPNEMERGGGEGGRKWRKQASCAPYSIWGGEGERGGGKHVLVTDCTPYTCSFPFHPSFSHRHSAAEASLDIKRLAWSRTVIDWHIKSGNKYL
jgi:hypothetical protein